MDNFVQKYALSKTLRFELKPVGETADKIKDFEGQAIKDIVKKDKQRAQDYKKIKKIIDDYHRDFIEHVLSQKILTDDDIQTAFDRYKAFKKSNNDKDLKKDFTDVQKKLRKKIADAFRKQAKLPEYRLFDAKLINEVKKEKPALLKWLEKQKIKPRELDQAKELVKNFGGWFTYFTGFNQNRQNIYSAEEQSTAISYRIVHDNIVRHFNNCRNFESIKQNHENLHNKLKAYNDVFVPTSFKSYLSQQGINDYNEKTGHKPEDKHAEGANQLISKYCQTNSTKEQKIKIPKMTKLFKQILSKKENGFKIDAFTNPREMADEITEFYNKLFVKENILQKLEDCFKEHFTEENLDGIYIKGDADLKNVLIYLYEGWNSIPEKLKSYTGQDEEDGSKKKKDFYSVKEIQEIIHQDFEDNLKLKDKQNSNDKEDLKEKNIFNYFVLFKKNYEVKKNTYEKIEISKRISQTYSNVKPVLDSQTEDDNLQNNEDKKKLQIFMDSLNSAVHFIKPLYMKKKGKWLLDSVDYNIDFYEDFNELYEKPATITKLYDKTRNYVTKKPYKTDKFKINFEKSNLLGGFVESRTEKSNNGTQYGGYLFRKRRVEDNLYDYYLGISSDAQLFRFEGVDYIEDSDKSEYERFYYYQMKSASFYGNSYIGNYSEDKAELIEIINSIVDDCDSSETKQRLSKDKTTPTSILTDISVKDEVLYDNVINNNKFKEKQEEVLNKIKRTLEEYTEKLPDIEKHLKNFPSSLNEAIDLISRIASVKSLIPLPVSQKEWEDVAGRNRNEKPLCLFKITNKDLKVKSSRHGKDNLHTMYFKSLLEQKQNVIDLGKGEIFFREASLDKEKQPKHVKGDVLKHKRYSKIWRELKSPVNKKITEKNLSAISSDIKIIDTQRGKTKVKNVLFNNKIIGKIATHGKIIKDKRFTKDKFFLHLSIKLNYQWPDVPNAKKQKSAFCYKFNDNINQQLKGNPDINIIGIDRGEKNLLYYTLINQKGEIIEQKSLNKLEDGRKEPVDYHQLLHTREKERADGRKSWSQIENIKELKSGYLSHIIHKVATLMIKHNAIVVLEDLNFGFKRKRFKVEKQVYQKFEKALIDKLNYLVFKDKALGQPGHYLNAYQLTAPFENLDELYKKKQSGFLFYVSPSYTSITDPVTGFVNRLKTGGNTLKDPTSFFKKFDKIRFDGEKNYFEFVFYYKNFFENTEEETEKWKTKKWTVCTTGKERYRHNRKDKQPICYNVTAELKKLFKEKQIAFENGENLVNSIAKINSVKFFKDLLFFLGLTLQLRHSYKDKDGQEIDFILSPVTDDNGNFFDSRKAKENQHKDADGNGAFNIARKGLMVLEQISKDGKPSPIRNVDWFDFVQNI